eukprot:TRINITY_DN28625_c0_g1_i3.p1 TRINITY_DN28625_c0_g1~~TRINITY_DN28625_c0_g1_i3.p1  ORF type:complete len:163 (-),score=35.41 TRINITY_DN28625_c0_g1_i3:52-540(-)
MDCSSELAHLMRRTEEALVVCESLRRGQEQLLQRVEKLEVSAAESEVTSEHVRLLQRENEQLQVQLREKATASSHALRRLDAMEHIFDENSKLRQEVAHLRRANERRDLDMAALQGQIDALTKLVRESLGGNSFGDLNLSESRMTPRNGGRISTGSQRFSAD